MAGKKEKNKNGNLLVYLLIILLAGSVSGVLSYFDAFQKLDYRIYDFVLKFKKDPEIDNRIVMVNIDDPSIERLGEWPWSRDVIADVMIRLKEFDAFTAVFDIEYISPSKMGIAPKATENISNGLASVENTVDENIAGLSSAIDNGYFSLNEVPQLLNEMSSDVIAPVFNDLNDYLLNNSFRDNDEYFAKSLQFFGNASLTVNTLDLHYIYDQSDIDYVHNRFLLKNVEDPDHRVIMDNNYTAKVMYSKDQKKGFSPAMNKLLTRANGVGFTNSFIDTDGVRRRMELLYDYDNDYLGQLAFAPFLKIVDSDKIVKNRREVVIKDATLNGEKKDLHIPLDNHGGFLVNWKKGLLADCFNCVSIINIKLMDTAEDNIIELLKYIYAKELSDEDGYQVDYTGHAASLINAYYDISDYKDNLLSKCTGFDDKGNVLDGISPEEYKEYFEARKNYFASVEEYLDANYLDSIFERLDELSLYYDDDVINEQKNDFQETFDLLKGEYKFYKENFDYLAKVFKGAYCIVGNTATSTTDLGATPFEQKFENVGIHASVLNTLLQEDYIYYIDWYWGFIIAVIFSIILLLLKNQSNTLQNIINGIIPLLFIFIPMFMLARFKRYIPSFGFSLYLITVYVAGVIYRFILSSREKRFITQMAASFANKDTVEQLRKNPELFKAAGENKRITALFTDIQKFSTFSESITRIYGPEEGAANLILHLNDYLGAMSNEILVNAGTIDKYEGDAIIAMFGAPDPMNTHTKEEWAYHTLDSAIRMKKIEQQFNDSHGDLFRTYDVQKEDGTVEQITLNPFKTRIGINSGDAFTGLMGSKTESFTKLNYTMIGDTVNLAARLEGVNKAYATWILCSEDTWKMANTGANLGKITVKRLDRVRVVGRSTPVQLYNIVGFTDELTSVQKEEIDLFHNALDKYLNKEFVTAGKLFIQASNMIGEDPTAMIFANRCKENIEKGVPENWDGVINMTSK